MSLRELINKALNNKETKERIPPQVKATSPITEFKCKYCGRADFKRVTELATHVRLAHKDERMKAIVAGAQARVNNHNERTPQPLTEQGQRLTKNGLLKKFPDYFKRIHNLGGCKMAFAKFPQWKAKLTARGEPLQAVYDALTTYRKSIGAIAPANAARIKTSTGEVVDLPLEKPKRGKKQRTQWSREHYDLAKAIMDDPQWRSRNGKDIDWDRAFATHANWKAFFNYTPDDSKFNSFIGRVRRGGGTRAKSSSMAVVPVEQVAAEPMTNGHTGIMVAGKSYEMSDLERIIKHYRELRFHLKACPDCGYNLKQHLQCYNIVKRHQAAAAAALIEEDI